MEGQLWPLEAAPLAGGWGDSPPIRKPKEKATCTYLPGKWR